MEDKFAVIYEKVVVTGYEYQYLSSYFTELVERNLFYFVELDTAQIFQCGYCPDSANNKPVFSPVLINLFQKRFFVYWWDIISENETDIISKIVHRGDHSIMSKCFTIKKHLYVESQHNVVDDESTVTINFQCGASSVRRRNTNLGIFWSLRLFDIQGGGGDGDECRFYLFYYRFVSNLSTGKK